MKSGEDAWWQFLNLCNKLKTTKELNEFFDLFLTFEEKEDLSKRYQVVQALIRAEIPQREISKKFNVSIFKITRGSNALKAISSNLRKFLKETMNST